jgi:hypothetical protein
MECGMRMLISWIPSFGLFFESPVFDCQAKIAMLHSIYDHAQFLASFKTSQNHLLRESNGLAAVSIFFPEFKQSQRWLQIALNRLDAELESQINTDGFHFELSTGYQWVVIDEFEKTRALLNIANRSLPAQNINNRLETMYNVLAYIARPDGSLPELNDGFIRWPINRLINAGKEYQRDDFCYVGANGKQGSAPQIASVAFENAGYYVMRSDWSQNANYLVFDSGPCNGYHAHEDKLNFEVFAFGVPFIVDSGSYTYDSTDPFRAYFVGSQGHNTILVDGCGQIRRWKADGLKAKKSNGNQAIWMQRPGFDFAAGIYEDGYGQFALEKPEHPDIIDDVIHARKILFVRPDYWLIIDKITSQKPHNYQLLFHGHPESEVYLVTEKTVTLQSKRNNACLYLIPAEKEKVQMDMKTGCETPIQGWYSIDHHSKTPSTAIFYEIHNTRSTIIATLVFPHSGTPTKSPARIEPIEVSEGRGIAYRVEIEKGTDYLMVSSHKGLKKFGGFQTLSTVAGFRLDNKGQIRSRFES